jgi:hypothetical protein
MKSMLMDHYKYEYRLMINYLAYYFFSLYFHIIIIKLNKEIRMNITDDVLKQYIDQIFDRYDRDRNGALDAD